MLLSSFVNVKDFVSFKRKSTLGTFYVEKFVEIKILKPGLQLYYICSLYCYLPVLIH
jgi:hypothetical protein